MAAGSGQDRITVITLGAIALGRKGMYSTDGIVFHV
jgi:hypothetical protein